MESEFKSKEIIALDCYIFWNLREYSEGVVPEFSEDRNSKIRW